MLIKYSEMDIQIGFKERQKASPVIYPSLSSKRIILELDESSTIFLDYLVDDLCCSNDK